MNVASQMGDRKASYLLSACLWSLFFPVSQFSSVPLGALDDPQTFGDLYIVGASLDACHCRSPVRVTVMSFQTFFPPIELLTFYSLLINNANPTISDLMGVVFN